MINLTVDTVSRILTADSYALGNQGEKGFQKFTVVIPKTYLTVDMSTFTAELDYVLPSGRPDTLPLGAATVGTSTLTYSNVDAPSNMFLESGYVKIQISTYLVDGSKFFSSSICKQFKVEPALDTKNKIAAQNPALITGLRTDVDSLEINKLDKSLYDAQVINAGNSNAEIVNARVGFPQLNDRLNDSDNTISTKSDISYVNTQIASVASGSPKGTYATVSALTTAYPTGNTNIYLVTADGKWYYWNGSAWVAGGTYQSTGIIDNSITPLKTTFIHRGKNLFNKLTVTAGYRIDASGTLIADAAFNLSDYISASPSTNYYKNTSAFVTGFYDSSKNFISSSSVSILVTPANCAYIRTNLTPAQMNTLQIELGSTGTTYEAYKEYLDNSYIRDILLSNINTESGNLGAIISGFINATTAIKLVNLYNANTRTNNYYVSNATGLLVAGTNFYTSDYITVKSSFNYTFNNKLWYIAYYDVNKVFISGATYTPQVLRTIATPSNCVYLRFSYWISDGNHNQIMVNEGNTSLPWIAYSQYVDSLNVYDSVNSKSLSDTLTLYQQLLNPNFVINLPDKIYGLVGKEINIYYDNVIVNDYKNYNFNVECSVGKQQNERWTCVSATAGTYPLTLSVYYNSILVATLTTSVIIKAATVGNAVNKKLIVLGDSTTDGGYATGELVNLFGASDVMDLTLLGSRGTAPNLHEGRSGWSTTTYINSASVDGVANAFWNGAFDFSYYMAQQAYTGVDYVIINLGINDVFSFTDDTSLNAEIVNVLARYQTMIDSIHAYSASVKIGIALTIPPSYNQDAFGASYADGQTKWRYKRNNNIWITALINQFKGKEAQYIYLAPINTNLDTQNNMQTEIVAVNSRNITTITRQKNGVHPSTTSDNSGYCQIADVYYYWLKGFEV